MLNAGSLHQCERKLFFVSHLSKYVLLSIREMSTNRGKKTVIKVNSEEDVAVALAKYTVKRSDKFIKEKGCFTVVLSGGTLIDTLRKLVEPPYINSVDWSKWLIFWVDERVVPLSDERSNYNLAWKGFLSKVPIPSRNIFAINDKKSPEGAADDYEACIKQLVDKNIIPLSKATGFPKFDLMLLGMGPDGHVASLFPSRPQRYDKKRWVTFIADSPKPPPPRITFTLPVINSASEIAMVVTGSELANAVETVLGDATCSELVSLPCFRVFRRSVSLPASEVSAEGELTWFLDKDAAAKL